MYRKLSKDEVLHDYNRSRNENRLHIYKILRIDYFIVYNTEIFY